MSHPVERRAEVVHELFARVRLPNLSSQLPCLLDVWVTSLHPEEICVWCELLRSLSCSWESGAVVIESFTGTWAVARPDKRGFGVIIRQGTAAREGKIRICLDIGFVSIPRGLRSALRCEMSIDSWEKLVGWSGVCENKTRNKRKERKYTFIDCN